MTAPQLPPFTGPDPGGTQLINGTQLHQAPPPSARPDRHSRPDRPAPPPPPRRLRGTRVRLRGAVRALAAALRCGQYPPGAPR